MSLEVRFGVELAKVRAYGSPRVLIPYGKGVMIGWTHVSEVWCDVDADEYRRNQEYERRLRALASTIQEAREFPFAPFSPTS